MGFIIVSPDYNNAQEQMQSFTVGLAHLNDDGKETKDASGASIPTYDNNDVMSYAKLLTSFTLQNDRGDIEQRRDSGSVDLMKNNRKTHDQLPKSNSRGGLSGTGTR